ncbi:hypothetical protein L4G92_08595 [Neisseria sp. ZJ106]|uniref:Uncharacterized protein n=1 Tax=Neisseria lisongii TaxID=2912188 RepID=A0ABY7RL67_9NEIS|nr:hypothetical protein [Neisseria lisongii]MCF7522100.1 hypothetical protein [Neisseria lisongii]WCL71958.1 hypothetical protein PJU73_02230 [Neisseria lisongii]
MEGGNKVNPVSPPSKQADKKVEKKEAHPPKAVDIPKADTHTATKMSSDIVSYQKPAEDVRKAKWAKFKRDPYLFCADSKNGLVRLGRVFFTKKQK